MAIYTTTLTSNLSDNDYSQMNDFVGQIKNIFLMSPYVLTISDNNPLDGSTKRVVELKVGDTSHYIKCDTRAYSSIGIEIRNNANTGQIGGSYTSFNPQNFLLKFLYNDHNILGNIGNIIFSRGEDNHWYPLPNQRCFNWNSDTQYDLKAASMGVQTSEGDSFLFPAYAHSSTIFFKWFNYVFKGLLNPTNESFYYDGTSYYFCKDGFLFKDE